MSDQGLRDALERICDDYAAIDVEMLRETLAAHAAEPAPVCICIKDAGEQWVLDRTGLLEADPACPIHGGPAEPAPDRQPSDAAVEALAQALARRDKRPFTWADLPPEDKSWYLDSAREGLVAAYRVDAPRPQEPTADGVDALLWAHRAVASNGTQTVCACDRDWRSDTEHRAHLRNAVLALLNGAE